MSEEENAILVSLEEDKAKQSYNSLMNAFKELESVIAQYENERPKDAESVNDTFTKIKSCEETLNNEVEKNEVNVEFLVSICN